MKNTHKKIDIVDIGRWRIKFTENRKHYFGFHSSWWSDSDFLALSSDAKTLFTWLLSQSLTQNKASLSICLDSACMVLRCSLDDIKDTLNELEHNNIIDLQTKTRKTVKSHRREENRIEENRIEEKEIKISASDIFYTEIVAKWNSECEQLGMPSVKVLSDTRKKKLALACKTFKEIEDWRKIFSVASNKSFVPAKGKPFRANWDYLFQDGNYIKFYEEYEIMFTEKEDTPGSIAAGEKKLKAMLGL
jgi:hypothetical protein